LLSKTKLIAAVTSVLCFSSSAHAAVQTFSFTASAFGSNLDGAPGPYEGPATIKLTYDIDQQPYKITGTGTEYAEEYYRGGAQPISVFVDGPLGVMTGTASYTRTHYTNDPDPRDPFTAFDQYIFNGSFNSKSGSSSPADFFSFFFLLDSGITPVGSPTSLSAAPLYAYEFGVANLSNNDATYKGFQGSFDASDVSPVAPSVPEPATWGMMILGMSAVGYVMRRSKNFSSTVKVA